MSAFGNIVLADGATTPVNHTFKPITIDKDGIAWYNDQATGIPIGYPILSLSLKRPKLGSSPGSNANGSVYRVNLKITNPTLEVTSPSTGSGIQPAPTVAYTDILNIEFVLSARGVLQNRKDLLAYAKAILARAEVTAMVQDLEDIY